MGLNKTIFCPGWVLTWCPPALRHTKLKVRIEVNSTFVQQSVHLTVLGVEEDQEGRKVTARLEVIQDKDRGKM